MGANAGLTMIGSVLLAREPEAVVLYDAEDQSEIQRIAQPGLLGATYLPEQNLVVLMRQSKLADDQA
jgi:hypothetical protein